MNDRLDDYIGELTRVFESAPSKHEAHRRSRPVLEDIAGDKGFIAAVLRRYLSTPLSLNSLNYPVVGIDIELNIYFHLLVNCWIPLPDRATDISTKAVHHHGNMLLTTVGLFGPGYEHWLFTKPVARDPERGLYDMNVVERKRHSVGHLAFVDAWTPHLPFYPEKLSLTLCLWSSQNQTAWSDRLKRVPFFKARRALFRDIARRLGLARSLDLKLVRDFDYTPSEGCFKRMQDRIEFPRGPNEDHLHSVFHILQETRNEDLACVVESEMDRRRDARDSALVRRLIEDLHAGRPIEGRLSEGHTTLPYANFTVRELERVLASPSNTNRGVCAS